MLLESLTIPPIFGKALLIFLAGVTGIYIFTWWREYQLPYRDLPKVEPVHWFWGSTPAILERPPGSTYADWIKRYGHTVRYTVFAGSPRILTTDPTAVTYVLGHPDVFVKSTQVRRALEGMMGNGLFVADGATHRRQRKILSPAFGQRALDDMMPVFLDKAYELKQKLVKIVDQDDESMPASPTPAVKSDNAVGGRKIDMQRYLAQATLDIIGLAGFNYDFKSLTSPYSELAVAYRDMISAAMNMTPLGVLQGVIPGMINIPTKLMRTVWASRTVIDRIGRELVDEIKMSMSLADGRSVEKRDVVGKDILSLIVRANMAADLIPAKRMSDAEVLAQISTFMLAGNETTATAHRLRRELASVLDERPSMETLSALPYLDAFIREVLRLYPPAPTLLRETTANCIIPFGQPVIGRDGSTVWQAILPRRTTVMIPSIVINRSPELWGSDAETFDPDRFLTRMAQTEEKWQQLPAIWGHLLTFGGGSRNCIGYRFALMGIKVILFVLLRHLAFEQLPSKPVVEKKTAIVMSPKIKGEDDAGVQMPLMVKILSA